MKKILICGRNSYIGTSVKNWLLKASSQYQISSLDVKKQSWENHDFSTYDVVFLVAGIAHIKETAENKQLYYKVNRDLAFEIAKKAKRDGVKQFIFLSTMSVYGIEHGVITIDSALNPKTAYGNSKLEAEVLIHSLSDHTFKVAILRPPMVYGKGSKGNYTELSNIAKSTPIFPNFKNKRSMIFIDNLSKYVRYLIDQDKEGLFFPQNEEYVNTSSMVNAIAQVNHNKIRFTKLFNPIIRRLNINIVKKVFGDLVYDKKMSKYPKDYKFTEFYDSIEKTEMVKDNE